MIEITPVVRPPRRTRRWVLLAAGGAAVAITAATVGFVAGRANRSHPAGASAAPAEAAATTPLVPGPSTTVPEVLGRSVAVPDTATTDSGQAVGGGGQYSPGAYPEDAGTLVAERTVGDVLLRAHLRSYPDFVPEWPQVPGWKPAEWCFADGDLRIGISGPDVINVAWVPHFGSPKDGLAVGTFSAGYVEGHPMFGVVAQVAADVTNVALTTPSGAGDATAPSNGVALLLVPGEIPESFTVEATHADGTTTSVDAAQLMAIWNSGQYEAACSPPQPAMPGPGQPMPLPAPMPPDAPILPPVVVTTVPATKDTGVRPDNTIEPPVAASAAGP